MPLECRVFLAFQRIVICLVASCAVAHAAYAQAQTGGRAAFELLHLWTSPIEQPALEVLKSAIVDSGLTWREHRVTGNFYGVRRELAARMALDVNPTAVFWIGARRQNSQDETNIFRRLDANLGAESLKTILLPEIVSQMGSGELGLEALPLVIHLQNVAILNSSVFNKLGLEQPRSWAQFLEIAPALKNAGVTPLAVSGQRWLFRFLYLSILADGLGPDEFESFLAAAMPRDRFVAIAKRSFEVLRALKPYSGRDYDSIGWDVAVRQTITGEAAMTISGDFASPALLGTDVICAAPPGDNFVMWSFDVIAFPVNKETEVQNIAIRSLSTKDVLTKFGVAKGGIPVIAHVDRSTLYPCSGSSLDRWQSQPKVLLSSEKWERSLNVMSSLVQIVWRSDSTDLDQAADRLFVEIAGAAK